MVLTVATKLTLSRIRVDHHDVRAARDVHAPRSRIHDHAVPVPFASEGYGSNHSIARTLRGGVQCLGREKHKPYRENRCPILQGEESPDPNVVAQWLARRTFFLFATLSRSCQLRLLVGYYLGAISGRDIYAESFPRVHRWIVSVARDRVGDNLVAVALI